MRSFWSDPYLWIHLAGLSAVPLFVEGCLVGFTLGDPFLPVWLELLLVATVGIAPILWMQWQRPFYIFSLVAVCLKPAALTDDQRKLLTLFKLPRNRVLAVFMSIALAVVLWNVYALAPLAASSVAFLPGSRLLGLSLAAAAFLACNLFVQVPLSVASVMLTDELTFAQTVPYSREQVQQGFSLLGLPLNQILPPVVTVPKQTIAPQTAVGDIPAPTDAIKAEAMTEPLADDLWAEAAAVSENSPIASDDQAFKGEAVTADLPDEGLEASTASANASIQADTLTEDTSTPVQPSSETERDDRGQ